MNGFFPASDLVSKAPLTLAPQCGRCGLYKTCKSPKMAVWGKGGKKILVLGEAPGREEDEQGRPFCGPSGKLLQEALDEVGISLGRDCWVTNSLICRPPRNQISNDDMVDWCRPNVIKVIEELRPEKVLLFGAVAVRSLIGWLWKEDTGGISRWAGWRVPCRKVNAWLCPTFHPSMLLRARKETGREDGLAEKMFRRHLAASSELVGRPWETVPNYKEKLRLVLDPDEAARIVRKLTKSRKSLAFDFETDRLKPDNQGRILCCAVSDGEVSVAYPWHGDAIEATREMLESDSPKFGYNVKFEARWAYHEFRTRIRNVEWDGMLAAHVLDNRKGICGLKFQAFALLGVDSYNDLVEPFMRAKGSNEPNRLAREVSLPKLLEYCATDALLEWEVAQVQRKQLGAD